MTTPSKADPREIARTIIREHLDRLITGESVLDEANNPLHAALWAEIDEPDGEQRIYSLGQRIGKGLSPKDQKPAVAATLRGQIPEVIDPDVPWQDLDQLLMGKGEYRTSVIVEPEDGSP